MILLFAISISMPLSFLGMEIEPSHEDKKVWFAMRYGDQHGTALYKGAENKDHIMRVPENSLKSFSQKIRQAPYNSVLELPKNYPIDAQCLINKEKLIISLADDDLYEINFAAIKKANNHWSRAAKILYSNISPRMVYRYFFL